MKTPDHSIHMKHAKDILLTALLGACMGTGLLAQEAEGIPQARVKTLQEELAGVRGTSPSEVRMQYKRMI